MPCIFYDKPCVCFYVRKPSFFLVIFHPFSCLQNMPQSRATSPRSYHYNGKTYPHRRMTYLHNNKFITFAAINMNNKKTFHEGSEIWCDAKRPIVKHSTLCAYQLTLQTHLLPRFGAAENITEKDVQQFVIDKCTSGLARKTVRDIVAAQICYQIWE